MTTKKEILRYYEEEYQVLNPTLHLEGSEFKASEILSVLPKKAVNQIHDLVELGCGAGGISRELCKTMECKRVVGCDLSSSILQVAKKVNTHLLLVKADCAQIPIRTKSADVVLLIDILEHLMEPSKIVAESARVTKRWLVVRTPIEDCLFYRLRKSEEVWVAEWKSRCGHLWMFNVPILRKLLEDNGFTVIKICISKHPLKLINGLSLGNVMTFVLTRLVPSVIYRKLFPAGHLILAKLKPALRNNIADHVGKIAVRSHSVR